MIVPNTSAAKMSATNDATQTDSWAGGSGTAETVQCSRDAGTVSAVQPLWRTLDEGWDPYDVWLRRIDLPRRQRRQLR